MRSDDKLCIRFVSVVRYWTYAISLARRSQKCRLKLKIVGRVLQVTFQSVLTSVGHDAVSFLDIRDRVSFCPCLYPHATKVAEFPPYSSLGWSWNRVKFQKMIYSSFLHKCTKKEGFPTRRGLNLKIKPWRQNYRLPMAIKKFHSNPIVLPTRFLVWFHTPACEKSFFYWTFVQRAQVY